MDAPDSGKRKGGGWRIARIAIAGGLLLALLSYVLASNWVGSLASCHEELDTAGHVVSLCRPAGITDGVVIIWLLVAALLLLPDFAEIAIPGLISLKRRVETQEHRQEALEQRLNVTAQARSEVNNYMAVDPRALEAATKGVQAAEDQTAAKEDAFTGRPAKTSAKPLAGQAEKAEMVKRLIATWEWLASRVADARAIEMRINAQVAGSQPSHFEEGSLELVRWAEEFREQLEYVQAVRNSVAHAKPIDGETIRKAVDLAETLEDSLVVRQSGRELVNRVSRWMMDQGVQSAATVHADGEFPVDFVGEKDGAIVLVECKVSRRAVRVAELKKWIRQLRQVATSVRKAKPILVILAPTISKAALGELASEHDVAVYSVEGDGELSLLTPFLDQAFGPRSGRLPFV